jgi:hypothetical protein
VKNWFSLFALSYFLLLFFFTLPWSSFGLTIDFAILSGSEAMTGMARVT